MSAKQAYLRAIKRGLTAKWAKLEDNRCEQEALLSELENLAEFTDYSEDFTREIRGTKTYLLIKKEIELTEEFQDFLSDTLETVERAIAE